MRVPLPRARALAIVLAIVPAALAVAASAAHAQTRAAQVRELDAYIVKGVQDWQIPGLSISVVRNDSVIFAKGYGVRRLGAPGAVDEQTLFGIMSTTKALTAMAVAMLVDEHKLAWNDPITKWLPEFQFSDPFLTREATVRDLLTHNIGLGNADLLWSRGDLSREEILRRVRFLPAAYSLRSSFIYQNVMYGTAGEVVARASGMSWDDFISTRIFRPLGMTRSYPTYVAMRAAKDANQSEPHYRIRDTIRVIADESVDPLPAAGAIWSSAADMAKWVRFLLDSGRVNGQRLVSEAGYRELFKPQSFVTASEFYPTARITKPHWTTYGLGWFEQDFRGRFLAFHTGSLDGRTAIIGLLPDERVGVYILGNLDHAEFRHALMLKVMDLFAGTNGGAPRDWSAEFLTLYSGLRTDGEKARVDAESKRVSGTRPSLALTEYAGTYKHPAWGDLQVTLDNGALRARLGAGNANTGMLEHWHYDTFRGSLGDGRGGANYLTFVIDPQGRASKVLLDGSEQYAFTRP
jgi:CubicO group peptidase (beta-lactamase class C family)